MKDKNDLMNESEAKYAFETMKHIHRVRELISIIITLFLGRCVGHDLSKLSKEEMKLFSGKRKSQPGLIYGSKKYEECLVSIGPALDHHYKSNSHHPEHYKDGVNGFDILDLGEMISDWVASAEIHDNEDIYKSLEISFRRFNIEPQLQNIITNTIIRFLI